MYWWEYARACGSVCVRVCVCSPVQAAAVPLRIAGATGPAASLVNGVYTPVPGELYNGHAIFVNAGEPDKYLRYLPNHSWAVGRTEDKDANNSRGWACSVEGGVALPQDAKSWRVGVGPDKWEVQPDVRVATLTPQVRAVGGVYMVCGRVSMCVFCTTACIH